MIFNLILLALFAVILPHLEIKLNGDGINEKMEINE